MTSPASPQPGYTGSTPAEHMPPPVTGQPSPHARPQQGREERERADRLDSTLTGLGYPPQPGNQRLSVPVTADAYGVRVDMRVHHIPDVTPEELARALDVAVAEAKARIHPRPARTA